MISAQRERNAADGDSSPDSQPAVHSLVQVGDLVAATLLDVTLPRTFGQVCPLLGGVAVGLLARGVGAVPGDGPSSRSAGYQPNSAATSARRLP